MLWLSEKVKETFSHFWIKLLAMIPSCFLIVDEREKIMIVALLTIMVIDCIFGIMVANYIKGNFSWNLLAKKFSKKFLLYFFTLTASFILSNAYEFVSWWFYIIGSLITFSEFGSLLAKSKKLGLPIKSQVLDIINCKLDETIKSLIGMQKSKDVLLKDKEEKEEK